MKRNPGVRWAIGALCVILGCGGMVRPSVAQEPRQTFVAQGTAPLQPTNRAQSRAQALEDLLRQAVLQAVGALVPGQALAQKNKEIRRDILSQAERYAQSFKILEEYVNGDLYRIQGAVDVAMGPLRVDLEKLGLVSTGPSQEGEPARKETEAARPPEEVGSAPTSEAQKPAPPASPRGLPERRILWAVAENWHGSWYAPTGRDPAPEGSFGAWVAEEAADYPWTLEFPAEAPSSLPWDGENQKRIMELARRQGQSHVAVGTATRAGETLEVHLNVMESNSGRVVGTVDERLSGTGRELAEGWLTLSAVTAAKIDTILSGGAGSPSPSRQPRPPSASPPAAPGDAWEIIVKGDASYAAWLSLEKRLSEISKDFLVDSIALEMEAVVVRAKSVDPNAVRSLDGMRFGMNFVVRVEGIDPSTRRITVTAGPAGTDAEAPPPQESKAP